MFVTTKPPQTPLTTDIKTEAGIAKQVFSSLCPKMPMRNPSAKRTPPPTYLAESFFLDFLDRFSLNRVSLDLLLLLVNVLDLGRSS